MKKVAMGLALALAASTAFAAHPQTINKHGFVGINKTQSAQSLGHSKLVFTLLGDGTFGNDMFPNNEVTGNAMHETFYGEDFKNGPIADFIGASAYVGFAIGIWHYFDVGVTLPVYYDQMNVEDSGLDRFGQPSALGAKGAISGTKAGYIGNLRGDLKIRFPLPEDQPMDVAVFGGVSAGTANAKKQGLWVREPEYINKLTGVAMPYGTKNTTISGGLAVTMDLGKMDMFPFLLHLNGGYRMTMNDEYLSMPFVSGGMEMYFMDFLSLFVEYYWDMDLDGFDYTAPYTEDGSFLKLDSKQLTGALVFHLPIGMDIHIGASYYLGGDNYLPNVMVLENADRSPEMVQWGDKIVEKNSITVDRIRVNPEYTVYGGITWSGFLLAQDRDGDGVTDDEDKCPDDYGHRLNQGCPLGNPDADEDGVCDSWVAEKGFQSEFAEVCEGIDQCPNEAGEGEDGCPLDDPDPDKDGVCDAWVSQKKMTKKFKDVCEGIDECPAQAGSAQFNGCPTKQPDPDGDGMCSPWVTDEGVANEFADVCKGYDMCPGEAGTKANKGCPWDDPDADGDGICDPWVTEKKMGYYFEKAGEDEKIRKEWFIEKSCKGIDKCPTEFGPANNEGCPLGLPDSDSDGICDPWVTEKGMQDQYDDICTGVDQCPTEAGEAFAKGCPMDNPDGDGDSLCSPWVTEKGMQKEFASMCHGIDKCPAENGPEWNKGCPADNPDPDGDSLCSPWVTKQKLLDQFADICTGYDRCEDEVGPKWNKGCPAEEEPDADGDGICSEWVTNRKLMKEFEGVCSGIDRCPDVPGDDGHGCPKKAVEKLDGVTFKSGKATLESNAKKILKSIAQKLNTEEYKDLNIVIQGHTDNVGKEKTNAKLSKQRAESVMKELSKAGVNKKRIKAIGLGSSCPVDDNSTADGREMNRRIEMHFATPDNDGTKCESTFAE